MIVYKQKTEASMQALMVMLQYKTMSNFTFHHPYAHPREGNTSINFSSSYSSEVMVDMTYSEVHS